MGFGRILQKLTRNNCPEAREKRIPLLLFITLVDCHTNQLSTELFLSKTSRKKLNNCNRKSPSKSKTMKNSRFKNTTTTSECLASGGFISFELITGYVLSAPAESMIMQPGTLQLTDCLNLCRQNSSCLAINFETGLCVLLQESADKNPQALQKSQFPVFTIYAHKICISGKCTIQFKFPFRLLQRVRE